MNTATICIPARLGGERFPNKVLADATGFPLIQHVLACAADSKVAEKIVIAADSMKIYDGVQGVTKVIVVPDAWCGTQRVAKAIELAPEEFDCKVVVVLQADEPCIFGEEIDAVIRAVLDGADIATMVGQKTTTNDQNIVKAICNKQRECRDFSRTLPGHHHVGVYAFARDSLPRIGELNPSDRSARFSLEQLTWLDAGYTIKSVKVERAPLAINCPTDYARFVREYRQLATKAR